MYFRPVLTRFQPRSPEKLYILDVITGKEFCEISVGTAIQTLSTTTKQASVIVDGLGKAYAITEYNYKRDAYTWKQLEQLP